MASYHLPDDPCFTELYPDIIPTAEPAESSSLYHDDLPPELWLKIFPELLPVDLCSVTLACSNFRHLAQPFLFKVIDVSPFFLAAYNGDENITLRPRKYLDRTVARLQFYTSNDRIARAVRQCWISPYARKGFPPRNHRDYLEPKLIIDAVVAALPFFPNLSRLAWHCIDISAEWWDVIHRLPIKDLWLNSCSVRAVDIPSFHVQQLDLDHWAWEGATTNHVSVHEKFAPGVSQDILSLVLHPERIERISVPRINTADSLLTTLTEMHTATTRLRSLIIPFFALRSSNFIPALELCPTLEELTLLQPSDEHATEVEIDPLPSSLIPYLSTFEGPSTHLLNFGKNRPLKRVKLWGMDESPYVSDPTRLLETLHQFSEINHTIESLHISICRVTFELLAILTSFPNIRAVTMEAADNPPLTPLPDTSEAGLRILTAKTPITILYMLLSDVYLPPRLEALRILTKLNHANLDVPTQEREVSQIAERLARNHSALRKIEVAYGTYWTGMYRAKWDRNRVPSGKMGDGKDGLLGTIDFEESKRNIVFRNVKRMSEEEWEEVREGRKRFGHVFVWLKKILARRYS